MRPSHKLLPLVLLGWFQVVGMLLASIWLPSRQWLLTALLVLVGSVLITVLYYEWRSDEESEIAMEEVRETVAKKTIQANPETDLASYLNLRPAAPEK